MGSKGEEELTLWHPQKYMQENMLDLAAMQDWPS